MPPATSFFSPFQSDWWLVCAVLTPSAATAETNSSSCSRRLPIRNTPVFTAGKILCALSTAHSIEGHDLHINGSIGISVYPEDGEDAETLIQNADTAMYHAKGRGRNNFQFFKADMNRKAVERQSLEAGLRLALERDQFLLHYQPKVNL